MPLPPPVIKIVLLVSFIIKPFSPWLTSVIFRSCFREFSPPNRRNRCPFRDRIALPLLALPGFRRRRHQVCRARTAEGFGERSRIAHVGRERFRALAHETVQPLQVTPHNAHLLALR